MLLVWQHIAEPPDASAHRQDRSEKTDRPLVTKPAKTKVRPKARMIGHAVGAGISIVSVRSVSSRVVCPMLILFSIQRPMHVNDGEDHNPNCVHEVPIERQARRCARRALASLLRRL